MTPGLAAALEGALERVVGRPTRVSGAEPLGGGCVNPAARVTTDQRETFFVKWNARAPRGLFDAEADDLRARAVRVPEVLAAGSGGPVPPWLLLEYVARGRPGPDYADLLGAGLARLHRAADRPWGWERDNFIGPLPQPNPASAKWGELWHDARLEPRLRRARERGHFPGRQGALLDRVLERTADLLADVTGRPSLLHGDLWGGNVFPDQEGRPVLIDPSAYRGHREVDLAMSELFGGFPAGWPQAYEHAWPLDPGCRAFRRALYQLYYLLVHVNLFGSGYEAGCVTAARAALLG